MVFITEHPKPRRLKANDYAYIGLPPSAWHARLDFVPDSTKVRVRAYLDDRTNVMRTAKGLVIHGEPRSGKTCIAAGIAKTMFAYGYSVFYTHGVKIRDANRYHTKFDDEQTVLARCENVDLLVIDDFCALDATNPFYGTEQFKQLMKHRVDWLKPSIVVTSAPLRNYVHPETIAVEFLYKAVPRMSLLLVDKHLEA